MACCQNACNIKKDKERDRIEVRKDRGEKGCKIMKSGGTKERGEKITERECYYYYFFFKEESACNHNEKIF